MKQEQARFLVMAVFLGAVSCKNPERQSSTPGPAKRDAQRLPENSDGGTRSVLHPPTQKTDAPEEPQPPAAPVSEPERRGKEDLAAVRIGKKWGYVDRQGKFVVNPQFDMARAFSEGLSTVRVEKKWGFIDRHGKFVINPQFENPTCSKGAYAGFSAPSFSEGLVVICIGKRWGYVDKQGKYVINPQFDEVKEFGSSEHEPLLMMLVLF